MRRLLLSTLLMCGSGLVLLGLGFLLVSGSAVLAQEDNQPEYIGARDCADCHRPLARNHNKTAHALALQDPGDEGAILADFGTGEDVRKVQFPGDSEARTFTADDIAYVIGAGRYIQRYLYETDSGDYAVLPAEWSTVTQTWQPYGNAANWPDDAAYTWGVSCAGCHTTGLDVEKVDWVDDGVQCEACHGPGSTHADTADEAGGELEPAELAAIRGAIVYSPDAQICGRCHSKGTSADGTHAFPVNYLPGGTLLDGYSLVAPDDPAHFWASGHTKDTNTQYNEWVNSAHASALDTLKSSPDAQDGCLQCHSGDYTFLERLRALTDAGEMEGDPPALPALDSAQVGVTCATCHSIHSEDGHNFFLAQESYGLCTSCHQGTDLTGSIHHPVMEMFEGRTVVEGIDGIPSAHFSAENGPRCVTCHLPRVPVSTFTLTSHLLRPVLPAESKDELPSTCSSCHSGLTPDDIQSLIDNTQDAVRERLSVALARLASVATPEAGSEAAGQYDRVVAALTFVQNEGSLGVHNYAYTDALLNAAARTLSQLAVPGASFAPTEAPAPTATPSGSFVPLETGGAPVSSGVRPMTVIVIVLVMAILLTAAFLFFRKSNVQEA